MYACNATRGERPVLNAHTTYTAVMAPAAAADDDAAMRVLLRDPPPPERCVP